MQQNKEALVATKPKNTPRKGKKAAVKSKRTSMWLGEDLLAASAKEAARLGVSRAFWVQTTLRNALGMPTLNLTATQTPEPTSDLSVFG